MHNRTSGNIPTNPISQIEAQAYINARAAYSYPKAYMVRAQGTQVPDIILSPTVMANYVQPQNGEVTDLWLDQYHHDLLHSQNADDRQLGLASVIYWGFYTHGHHYASNRVQWHVAGHRGMQPTTANSALNSTNSCAIHLNNNCPGLALSQFLNLSQLGSVPFASKVVSFMAPSIAGVFDNRINDGIERIPSLFHVHGAVKSVGDARCQEKYQAWCSYLTFIASQLNLGIYHGETWCWSCGEDRRQLWRAVDVERAIFAIFGSAKSAGSNGGAGGHAANNAGVRVPKDGSKMKKAEAIFNENPRAPSVEVRRRFVEEAGLTQSGANTYYYKIRRDYNGGSR